MRKRWWSMALLAAMGVPLQGALAGGAESPALVARVVRGTVADAQGHAVAKARVRIETRDGRVVARTQSDANGEFVLREVAPDTYTVVVSKEQFEVTTAETVVTAAQDVTLPITLQSSPEEDLVVTAKRLDRARNDVYTKTGGSVYHFDDQAIHDLPRGENTPLNEVILQAPGVAQDSFGQLHVRGDHGNLQYRINGIPLPEGINGFSQTLSPRFASNVDLLTGALPAEYGLRTAGVIDIQTKTGYTHPGLDLDLYGGQRGTVSPTLEFGGSSGKLDYYGTLSYFRSNRFVEPPTGGPTPINGETNQGKAFGYFSYLLDPDTRISFVSGSAVTEFGIPAARGVMPAFTLDDVTDFASEDVRESQKEENYYNVLALQGSALDAKLDYQVAAFSRYSRLAFYPDPVGDLIFNGVASDVIRSSFTNGLQSDASYKLTDSHTLHAGLFFHANRADVKNASAVFPADENGMQTSTTPFTIVDNTAITEWLYSIYLQDAWQPLEGLTVNYGVRFDGAQSFSDTQEVSPRFGLVYKVADSTVLHAGYARYFTPPPPELVSLKSIDKFQNTTNAVSSDVNTVVTPDRSHYFDIGANHTLLPGVTIGADGYYKVSHDLLDEGQFGQALVISPFNYKKGQVFGAEGTASWVVNDFSGYLNFAYSKALGKEVASAQFNFEPDELAFIEHHYVHLDHDQTYTASGGIGYRYRGFLFTATTIAGSGLRNGFVNSGHLPYYTQTDLGVERGFEVPHFGQLQLRGSVVNLFDYQYLIRDGTGIGVQSAQQGPRRAFYVGLTVPLPFTRGSAPSGSPS